MYFLMAKATSINTIIDAKTITGIIQSFDSGDDVLSESDTTAIVLNPANEDVLSNLSPTSLYTDMVTLS